ncbi:hypothetical protein MKS88_004135 [Plasmodium brasilianum]|uniref:Uncharacterized protein n=1 Tax=Plasmodium brasilianum TaxID=5824 RepID=A0ACB9Y3W9_PLABR|nr:hypothetical protein MKS88_004135 [Plasmodium brasilianum]
MSTINKKRKKKKIFSDEEDSKSNEIEHTSIEVSSERATKNKPLLCTNGIDAYEHDPVDKSEGEELIEGNITKKVEDVGEEGDDRNGGDINNNDINGYIRSESGNIEQGKNGDDKSEHSQNDTQQSNKCEDILKQKKKKKKLKKCTMQEDASGNDTTDMIESRNIEYTLNRNDSGETNNTNEDASSGENSLKENNSKKLGEGKHEEETTFHKMINEKKKKKKRKVHKMEEVQEMNDHEGKQWKSEDENDGKEQQQEQDQTQKQRVVNHSEDNEEEDLWRDQKNELEIFEKAGTHKKGDKRANQRRDDNNIDEQGEGREREGEEIKTSVKEKQKKKKIKNSKLIDNINPNEDKLKLKAVQIAFIKKEYNVEEYIFECLKIIIPINKSELFLGKENIILDNSSKDDIKNLEIFWFDRLTRNRRRSIINCFTTMRKLGVLNSGGNTFKDSYSVAPPTSIEAATGDRTSLEDKPHPMEDKGIPTIDHIFNKSKEYIIVDNLVCLCNQQIKLIKEYISYIKRNIYDLSSITENNEKIKEMKILEPIKRREIFFYLNICIAMSYAQECTPNVYGLHTCATPDIRGFNLHPMFSHINKKKNELRNDHVTDPWEKLRLLKKHGRKIETSSKYDITNRNKNSYNESSSMNKSNAGEKIAQNKFCSEGNNNADDAEERERKHYEEMERKRKELEDLERKNKAIEEMKKKKKEKDDKKIYNIYSLLESAAQYFGEGPKYSNPNIHEFYKSNSNQLVYVKPPNTIEEKNLLINYFLQFPSLNKKLEYNKRRIYAENYGLVKIIKNNENLPTNFELHTQPWLLESFQNMWNEQNKLNNFQIWNMSNLVNDDDPLEDVQCTDTKVAAPNQTQDSKNVFVKIEAAGGGQDVTLKCVQVKGEEVTSQSLQVKGEEVTSQSLQVKGEEVTSQSLQVKGEEVTSQSVQVKGGEVTSQSLQVKGEEVTSQSVQVKGGEVTSQSVQVKGEEVTSQSVQVKGEEVTSQSVQVKGEEVTSQSVQVKGEEVTSQSVQVKGEEVTSQCAHLKEESTRQKVCNEEVPSFTNDTNQGKTSKWGSGITNTEISKSENKRKSDFLTKKIKKFCSNDDTKQLKLTSFLSKDKVNINVEGERIESKEHDPIAEHMKDEVTNLSYVASESEKLDYVKIKKKKRRILDDDKMNDMCENYQQKSEIANKYDNTNEENHEEDFADDDKNYCSSQKSYNRFEGNYSISKRKNITSQKDNSKQEDLSDYSSEQKDEEKVRNIRKRKKNDENEQDIINPVDIIMKQKYAEEKKRLREDKMKHVFELEAEESEDENIEDPEERKRAQLLKNSKYQQDDSEDDDQYNSEGLSEFINNEEYNSDNDIVKLKHKEEMEKFEENMFLKKFTYQGKEFNKELTNKEKLELEREKQLLRKKKLLLNCSLGNVKLSDFESDSSTSSDDDTKKYLKNSLYEPFTELENVDMLKKNKNFIDNSFNDNVFKRGECIGNIDDEKRKKQILEKIDNVIYRKEVKTNEGKKIVIKKKRKIRFHHELSDLTVTEEEQVDEYEKTKKKPKKVNSNLVEQPKPIFIQNKTINHNNKASIKWNNNIKYINELDTPTNSEVFKGFRKVENAQ